MNLIEALNQSHKNIRSLGEKLANCADTEQQLALFAELWQQFFLHEHAEEQIAFQLMVKKDISNQQFTDKTLQYAVDEHHYFEQFVENIALMPPNRPECYKLMQELVLQLDSHMKHEEAYIFPRLTEQLNDEQNERLTAQYLHALKLK
ncbi:hemerythrin HHE cation binding domain-containing protein [Moraxella macacae 0408225]|uniref:Hemerythrin HHE cation binding domain-containing protein n=1 Tax=Moraxella macacae 0408225 TaxID=1230338 RepID=L2F5R4_9GAMM|nr:hemerythrin domain-containing protein [Moraxella macacae]ELA08372.1 hemerythrin HHE cation binding domain-containing protein [Moraxella macacae 0408225]